MTGYGRQRHGRVVPLEPDDVRVDEPAGRTRAVHVPDDQAVERARGVVLDLGPLGRIEPQQIVQREPIGRDLVHEMRP